MSRQVLATRDGMLGNAASAHRARSRHVWSPECPYDQASSSAIRMPFDGVEALLVACQFMVEW